MIRKSEGFTLIEVLITMVILAVGLLGMGALVVSVIQGNAQSNKITTATTLAQDRLEEIKTVGYTLASKTENYGEIDGYPAYRRVTQVTDNTPAPRTSTVTVTVFWDSDDHSVALSTIISE